MQNEDEWEDIERDKLARHIYESMTETERYDWLESLFSREFANDMAARIKQQPLEREADGYLRSCSRKHINDWIESKGYEEDRIEWRQRMNRALFRRRAAQA